MTKQNFFRYYNKLSGADKYIVMFEYNGKLWKAIVDHIRPIWTYENRESTKNGGWQKWKMRLTLAHKENLIKRGAVVIADMETFNSLPYSNKGHRCEYLLHELHNLGTYKPDNKRFDKGGDIEIDGIQYQVKFENATLTNVNVLHKAQRDARGRK